MDYRLRQVSQDDVDWLLQLRMQTMADYLLQSGENLSAQDHLARVQYQFNDIQIIQQHHQDVGMIKLHKTANKWQLVQIQLLPKCHGNGLGSAIIKDVIVQAQQHAVPLYLSVLKVNPAQVLYRRLGFKEVEQSNSAIEMCLEVTGSELPR